MSKLPPLFTLFIEALLKGFEFIPSQDTALPPSSPKTGSITDKLNKGCGDRVYPYAQTAITASRINTNQQSIK